MSLELAKTPVADGHSTDVSAISPRAVPREAVKSLIFVVLAVIAGVVDVWSLIGVQHINPRNLSWIIADPAAYQGAWEFLRHAQSWKFPLTWVDDLGYPLGVSTSYMDVIPLVAVPLRLLSPLLPTDFQYLGLYAVACHVLQAYFGFKLVSRFSRDLVTSVIGGLFILLAPVLTWRLLGHYALSTQWVIVAAFYYYFGPLAKGFGRYMLPFVVLSALASAINPYISLFANLIAAAAVLRARFEGHATTARSCVAVAVLASVTLAVLALFGFLGGGQATQFAGAGYTVYSMNLLAPINPEGYPSIALKKFGEVNAGQIEGYNYLGLGVLLLLGVAFARKPSMVSKAWSLPLLPLFLISVAFTLLALSIKITLGSHVIATIPASEKLVQALASFRASGRLFWPVHYLLILSAVVGAVATIRGRWALRLVLAGALAIQIVDVMPLRHAVRTNARVNADSPLVSPEWAKLSAHHRHLVVLPAWQCGPTETPGGMEEWYWFAKLAARTGLTVNSFYAARVSDAAADLYCSKMPADVLENGPAEDTAYVVNKDLLFAILWRGGNHHYCRQVDGLYLCTYQPEMASRSRLSISESLPKYILGTEFTVRDGASISLIGSEPVGGPIGWTIGHTMRIYLRPELPETGDLRLEAEISSALVNERHPTQKAIVKVNGQAVGTWEFSLTNQQHTPSVVIPRELLHDGEAMEITLEMPDAIAPADIGINEDRRVLAFILKGFRLVPASPRQPAG